MKPMKLLGVLSYTGCYDTSVMLPCMLSYTGCYDTCVCLEGKQRPPSHLCTYLLVSFFLREAARQNLGKGLPKVFRVTQLPQFGV